MSVELSVDLSQFRDDIQAIGDAQNKALSNALNWTAYDSKAAMRKEMDSVFDDATPWTLNSIFVKQAKPSSLSATVGIKNQTASGTSAAEYLRSQVEGGDRSVKAIERLLQKTGVIPNGHRLVIAQSGTKNRYGNITKGRMKKMVGDLKQGRRKGGKYFVMNHGSKSSAKPFGIFQRRSKKKLIPVFGIDNGRMDYDAIFDFYEVARKVRDNKFSYLYRKALLKEIRRRL